MGRPDWFNQKAGKRRQNRRSAALERSVATTVSGRVQPGSGSSWRARGDVKNDIYLIEHKYTEKESYSVKKRTWQNLQRIATDNGKQPALVIHFGSDHTAPAIIITGYED